MTFEEWAEAQEPTIIRDVFSAAAAWIAAKESERERIKRIVQEVNTQVDHNIWASCVHEILKRIEE